MSVFTLKQFKKKAYIQVENITQCGKMLIVENSGG